MFSIPRVSSPRLLPQPKPHDGALNVCVFPTPAARVVGRPRPKHTRGDPAHFVRGWALAEEEDWKKSGGLPALAKRRPAGWATRASKGCSGLYVQTRRHQAGGSWGGLHNSVSQFRAPAANCTALQPIHISQRRTSARTSVWVLALNLGRRGQQRGSL